MTRIQSSELRMTGADRSDDLQRNVLDMIWTGTGWQVRGLDSFVRCTDAG